MAICCECKEQINQAATRCHHCTAQQGWLRFMVKGPVVATFVLTMVSIMSAQPIAELIQKKTAEINVSILEGDFLHTTFMVSNTGNRPAGLTQVEITTEGKYGGASWYLITDLDNKLIEPGKAYVLKGANGSAIPEPLSHEHLAAMTKAGVKPEEKCDLVLQYVQMNGTKYYQHLPFACNPPTNYDKPFEKAPAG
jgi:hypothetical protein